ncbi:predicted protein [Plenodomus lingam JN3]|uniref:Predicted protein n=1 Tax=Leptosphaeria maculans (strain JN3 / isolate v23.1.3 / race Av1-4-5-6-7-8) TaxID=985895 RepID=E5A0A7_LEPMJ|nr:predicted protein [Plenodomus lingam JN3]CBX96967.1 predicted protein [Plenodomus lingam JN3]
MSWFVPFVLVLALAWAAVGILLARWLKQAGYAKPLKGRDLSSRDLYGGGAGYGRMGDQGGLRGQVHGAGSRVYVGGGWNGRTVGLGQFGNGGGRGV